MFALYLHLQAVDSELIFIFIFNYVFAHMHILDSLICLNLILLDFIVPVVNTRWGCLPEAKNY